MHFKMWSGFFGPACTRSLLAHLEITKFITAVQLETEVNWLDLRLKVKVQGHSETRCTFTAGGSILIDRLTIYHLSKKNCTISLLQ